MSPQLEQVSKWMFGSQSCPGPRGRGEDAIPHLCVPAPQLFQPLPGQLLLLLLLLLQELPDSVAGPDRDGKVRVHFFLERKGRAVRPQTIT